MISLLHCWRILGLSWLWRSERRGGKYSRGDGDDDNDSDGDPDDGDDNDDDDDSNEVIWDDPDRLLFPGRVTAPPPATALLQLMVSATSVTPDSSLLPPSHHQPPDCSMLPDCYKS